MNIPFLTQLPITYADSFSFANSGSSFQVQISNVEHQLVIVLKNVLTFSFSKETLKPDEDWLDIIEITHEYRKPTNHDLGKSSFSAENTDKLPPLHIVTLYGNAAIEIICEEIEVRRSVVSQEGQSEMI
jgi:hypothetical protein